MTKKAALEPWQIGYVIEQQDRTFRVTRSLAADIKRGDGNSIRPAVAVMATTLASQSELIAGMAKILAAVSPAELEKALAATGVSLESGDGRT